MLLNKLSLVLTLVLIFRIKAETKSYEGWKLVKIFVSTQEQAELIRKLSDDNPNIDLWDESLSLNKPLKALISPDGFENLTENFKSNEITIQIVNENYQNILDEQKDENDQLSKSVFSAVGKYATYDEISDYINETVFENYQFASSYVIGETFEKRELRVVVLRSHTSQRKIWIDCGIHAREWISVSTCVWIIDKLIADYKNNEPDVVELLSYYEIFILPVLNPDGYQYTHTDDRMWRKNRSPNKGTSCRGTDLNRNFKHKWSTVGVSRDPCSEIYSGPKADSELETQALEKAILSYQGQWDAYISLHAFGQFWFTPIGYTLDLPDNFDKLDEKARIGAEAIANVYNEGVWQHGSGAHLIYLTSGSSDDWTYGVANITYSHTIELRPDFDSEDGFALPPDRIPLAGDETYAGIMAFLKAVKKEYSNSK